MRPSTMPIFSGEGQSERKPALLSTTLSSSIKRLADSSRTAALECERLERVGVVHELVRALVLVLELAILVFGICRPDAMLCKRKTFT